MADLPERLNELLGGRTYGDKRIARLAAHVETDRTRIHSWLTGTSTPRVEALASIADYFGVSMDYLWGRSDDPGTTSEAPAEPEPQPRRRAARQSK